MYWWAPKGWNSCLWLFFLLLDDWGTAVTGYHQITVHLPCFNTNTGALQAGRRIINYPVITSLSLTVWDNITWTFCFIYTVLWSVHFVSFYSIFKPVLADRSQFKVCMKQLPASERLPNKTIWRARKIFGEARSKFLAFDEWLRCIAGTKRYQQHWCRREWPATLPRWPTPIMFINSRIVHWRVAQYHRFAEMMIPPIQWKGMLRSFITS